ncbi:hypothetical protein AVEN_23636-1 [Araneus ventricosus]|uniref:Uncharacterized protein n=1 Tax=Araneus ventricosus TaxID=182803 RepID=A0A4Y2BK12_ARAVE|nr:hypothetical protein AVEN_23636-1 [Araneus ventricosus]
MKDDPKTGIPFMPTGDLHIEEVHVLIHANYSLTMRLRNIRKTNVTQLLNNLLKHCIAAKPVSCLLTKEQSINRVASQVAGTFKCGWKLSKTFRNRSLLFRLYPMDFILFSKLKSTFKYRRFGKKRGKFFMYDPKKRFPGAIPAMEDTLKAVYK